MTVKNVNFSMAPAAFIKRSQPETRHSHHDHNHHSQPETRSDTPQLSRRKALLACCKKATKFTFSNLGLCVLMALYAVAGAYMFMQLEQTNEKELCIQVS